MKRKDVLMASIVFLCGSSPLTGSGATPARASTTRMVESYTGTIVSLNGERFILRDDDDGVWFNLDDQTGASKFAGKRVEVVGRLDPQTGVIHVEQIQEEDKK